MHRRGRRMDARSRSCVSLVASPHRRSDGDSGDRWRRTTADDDERPRCPETPSSRSRVGARRQVACRWRSTLGERLPRHLADCGRRRRAALAHEPTQRRSRRTARILAGWKSSGFCPAIAAPALVGARPFALARADGLGSTDPSRIRGPGHRGTGVDTGRPRSGVLVSNGPPRWLGSQKVSLSRRADEPIGQPVRLALGQGALQVSVADRVGSCTRRHSGIPRSGNCPLEASPIGRSQCPSFQRRSTSKLLTTHPTAND